jgi:hypothetical protein
MAFDKKGACWLSESKTIKNPCFGEKIDCLFKIFGQYRNAHKRELDYLYNKYVTKNGCKE